jgi:hypothetical protein
MWRTSGGPPLLAHLKPFALEQLEFGLAHVRQAIHQMDGNLVAAEQGRQDRGEGLLALTGH